MLPAQRRQAILRAVRSGTAHVTALADEFGVSEMTVRRDLQALASDGKLERVHGGAVNVESERPFSEIAVERLEAKDRIGRAGAALVEDGQTVMIDIGTTTLQVARHLRGRSLTVITTNLAAYEELLPEPGIELVLPGGSVRRNYLSLVGMIAEDSLRRLRADIAFLGTSGIDKDLAVWDTTMVEVPIKRAMIAASQRTVLLADAAKFGMDAMVRVCEASEIDAVITDERVPGDRRKALDEAGVEVIVA
jgi:DeoR/GlpR family transcriptional regulator of sugar metabolism